MTTDTIIAGSAFVLSIYGIFSTKRHNRLSVTPHIVANRHFTRRDDGFLYSYDLCNHGVGPARITAFTVLLDGKPFTCAKGKDLIEELFIARIAGRVEYTMLISSVPQRNYCLLPGQTHRICEFFIPGATRADEDRLNAVFKGTDLRVEYESFYSEKFVFDTRD